MNRLITNEQPKSVPVRKSNNILCLRVGSETGLHISRICHIAPKIQSVIARTTLALPVNTMAKKEDTQRPKRCTRLANRYARSESFTSPHLTPERSNDRTFGGRVAEESRLTMIAGVLPTALISYYYYIYCSSSSSHPPPTTTTIFLHHQQKLKTPCTSLPPSELTQLQALCGTEHRAFVPPIDLNRPDVVSFKRGRPRSYYRLYVVLKKKVAWLPQCSTQQGHKSL